MLPYLFTPLHTNPSPLPLASQIKKKKKRAKSNQVSANKRIMSINDLDLLKKQSQNSK